MAREFVYPDFVEGMTAEEIQQRMMNSLPEDIDGMPGGFAYDFTMPTAIEKSEMINFHLVRVLMLMFPNWAWGDWLDLHGKQKSVARKAANYAQGHITITGEEGTYLPEGFVVCTAATDSVPSVLFELDEEVIIPEAGTVTVGITAVDAGKASNVAAGTIIIMQNPVNGVISITNEEAVTGGTEIEDDESYRERIEDAYANENVSFIGNDNDLKRWAKEVTGIGDCIVSAAWNGPGTIKLALIDSNGDPANEALCTAVYNHIISPNNRMERLLQAGSATLTVVPATTFSMAYICTGIEYDSTTDLDTITERYEAALKEYYVTAKEEGEIRYVRVHALLADIPGVVDFASLTMNGGTSNITLEEAEYPATSSLVISE